MQKHVVYDKTKELVILSLLVASEIVLNRFLSINTAGIKIGFSFVPIVIAAFLFGPISSGIVYAVADFMGAIFFPIGPYHPGFTVCAFLMGLMYGIFLYKKQQVKIFKNVLPPVLINNILLGLLINTVWVSMLYKSKNYWGWFLFRLSEYAVLIPVSLIMIPSIIRVCKIIKKHTVK